MCPVIRRLSHSQEPPLPGHRAGGRIYVDERPRGDSRRVSSHSEPKRQEAQNVVVGPGDPAFTLHRHQNKMG